MENIDTCYEKDPLSHSVRRSAHTGGESVIESLPSFNRAIERPIPNVPPEFNLVMHMIGDAIACLKDRWCKKIERTRAFDWLFSDDVDEEGTLYFWATLVDLDTKFLRTIAALYIVSDAKFANAVKHWQ